MIDDLLVQGLLEEVVLLSLVLERVGRHVPDLIFQVDLVLPHILDEQLPRRRQRLAVAVRRVNAERLDDGRLAPDVENQYQVAGIVEHR